MRKIVILMVILLLTACEQGSGIGDQGSENEQQSTVNNQQLTNNQSPVSDQPPTASGQQPPANLTILYTNDEHGWMEGVEPGRGAASLVATWREEGLLDDNTLILSGGDMWTGPAISTWFDGESMADVMNAMNYTAAAVGNHEFDFGLDALRTRAEESTFPFVSANIRYTSDGTTPTDVGIQPYVIVEVNGVQVGITGLTTTSTPRTTNPINVAEFEFLRYEDALREIVPAMLAEGAELILVPGHICEDELRQLASQIGDLGVHMLGGGHCNELVADEVNGIILLEGGTQLANYAYATLTFDTESDTVVSADYGIDTNPEVAMVDSAVDGVVMAWQDMAQDELDFVVGYTENGIERRSPEQLALVVESWLWGYPADVAISNLGGFRDGFPAGQITLGDIIGVLPFSNVIIELEVTGDQLIDILNAGTAAVGGAHRSAGRWVLNSGDTIDNDALYTVLVNDFMYAGGDSWSLLARFDPNAYDTAIDWRQPVIDWLEAQNSSPDNPIDPFLAELVN